MKKIAGSILSFLVLVFGPLFSFWWLFLVLGAAAALWRGAFYSLILAGFVLDLVYLAGSPRLPLLTIFGLILALASLFARNRLRF